MASIEPTRGRSPGARDEGDDEWTIHALGAFGACRFLVVVVRPPERCCHFIFLEALSRARASTAPRGEGHAAATMPATRPSWVMTHAVVRSETRGRRVRSGFRSTVRPPARRTSGNAQRPAFSTRRSRLTDHRASSTTASSSSAFVTTLPSSPRSKRSVPVPARRTSPPRTLRAW